jgi:hypothetical protein
VDVQHVKPCITLCIKEDAISIDLHIHTCYSDGKYTPEEVLRRAAEIGLTTIAITDHDNTNGIRQARPLAAQLGIELIPAIEFTSRWPPGPDENRHLIPREDIDLLGYFVDLNNPEFRAFEQATLNDIHNRVSACCERLTQAGYPISLDDVFMENERYAGVLQLVYALQRKGHASDWEATLSLVEPPWREGRLSPFTIGQVIEQIHLAGGVAILAHPIDVRRGNNGEWLQADQLARLVEMGLDGLEVYHFRLNEAARAHFLALAKQFDLLVSGGSDLHGWFTDIERLGQQPVTQAMVEALRTRHQHYATCL